MATQIGVITALIGTATATGLDGTVRNLQLGDKVFANDLIATGNAGAIEIEFADGNVMDMGRSSQTLLNTDVYDPAAASHNLAQAQANVDAIQQAILSGQDPTKVGDATAAGAGPQGAGDQVHSPVYVDYLAPEVTPQAGFNTTGPSNTFFQPPGGTYYAQTAPTTAAESQLIVGSNASDNSSSSASYVVSTTNTDSGSIIGGNGNDILVGDAGGVGNSGESQNYNVVLILDLSGSEQSSLSTYQEAIRNYVSELHDYQHGQINIGIIPFSTEVNTSQVGWFQNVADTNTLNSIDSFINNMQASGYTNYEAALAYARDFISQHNAAGYVNQAVFITDGHPNTLVDNFGTSFQTLSEARVLAELTGTYTASHPGSPNFFGGIDGNDQVSEINNLHQVSSDIQVYTIGVGVANDSTEVQILNLVASHNYISIPGIDSLSGALSSTSPTHTLAGVGSDIINGGAGNDIIFGDSINTDALAQAQGLTTPSGDGWDVFTRLENGQGTTANWSRSDTLQYIQTHHQALAQESLNSDGSGRSGGNDQLYGGAGNDIIYGQEGNDTISGGSGNDIISGGSGNDIMSGGAGNDTFVWGANDAGTTSAPAEDTITDFSSGDVLNIADLLVGEESGDITNYLKVSQNGSDVVINVSPDGSGSTGVTENITLQNTSLADLGAGAFNPSTQQADIIHTLINNGHIAVDHT